MAIAGRKYKILLFLLAVLVIALAGERIWTEFRLRKIERHDSAAKLALENNQLQREISQLRRQTVSADNPDRDDVLFTPDGMPKYLVNERGQAFFLFSTDCEACEAESGKWPVLAARLETLGYQVNYICIEGFDGIADYAAKHHLGTNMLLDRQGAMATEYGVAFTPCRIIVDADGNVEYKDSRQLLPEERLAALDKFLEQKELLAGKDAFVYVQKVFPEANRCVPRTFTGKGFGDVYFEVFKDATRLGFARKVHREIACDVCWDVDFVVGIDMAGRIRKVELLSGEDDIELPKRIGISVFISACIALVTGLISSRRKWFGAKPYKRLFVSLALFTVLSAVSYASIEIAFPRMSVPEFLRQFDGRRVEPSLRLKADGGDVQSMTGATKSSREIAKGLVETLSLFENDAPPEGKTLENHNNTQ